MKLYISLLAALFLFAFLSSASQPFSLPPWHALLFWSLIAFVLARLTVPLPLIGTLSLHFVGALSLAFAFPPPIAAFLSAITLLPSKRFNPWQEVFNRSQVGLATLLASTLFHHAPVREIGVFLAGMTYFLVNLGSVLLLAWLLKGLPPTELWRRNFAPYGITYLLVSPVAYLMTQLYSHPLVGSWGGFGVILAVLPLDLAQHLGLSQTQQDVILLGGRLHDIGKVGVPDAVLGKPGRLSPEEWSAMRSHPEVGYRIVAPMLPYLGPVDEIIRYHHERYDGNGYPYGLRGTEIPLLARIVAVADAYEAMTSHRPYRRALPVEIAVEEIVKGAGTQFDPEVVEAFLLAVRKNPVWLDRDRFVLRTMEVEA